MYFMWVAYALGTSAGLMVISQLVPFARSKGTPLGLATTAIFVGAAGSFRGGYRMPLVASTPCA